MRAWDEADGASNQMGPELHFPANVPVSDDGGLVLSRRAFDAVLFDLDGVLTRTASLHLEAWRETFDAFLADHARRSGAPFRPFDDEDYVRYVDGRRRLDGVRTFLESRGIRLRSGGSADPAGAPTEHGLAAEKNERYLALLRTEGAPPFEAAVALVCSLRATGFRTAVVSASRNCGAVLEAAGIQALFDATVDGVDQARLGLAGKPAPDLFLEAARRVGAEPARAVVVEDALPGVTAGRKGCFGLVLGVARDHDAAALLKAGAHLVVNDLGGVRVSGERGG